MCFSHVRWQSRVTPSSLACWTCSINFPLIMTSRQWSFRRWNFCWVEIKIVLNVLRAMSFKLAHANTPEATRLRRAFNSWIVELDWVAKNERHISGTSEEIASGEIFFCLYCWHMYVFFLAFSVVSGFLERNTYSTYMRNKFQRNSWIRSPKLVRPCDFSELYQSSLFCGQIQSCWTSRE